MAWVFFSVVSGRVVQSQNFRTVFRQSRTVFEDWFWSWD